MAKCIRTELCKAWNLLGKIVRIIYNHSDDKNMIKKVTGECEEANRQYVAALNGLAGLDIIEDKTAEAVENYRTVLR